MQDTSIRLRRIGKSDAANHGLDVLALGLGRRSEDTARIARRVLGGTHPHTAGIEDALRDARTVLRTHEAEATEAAAQDAFRTARVKLAQERSELAGALADMRVADDEG